MGKHTNFKAQVHVYGIFLHYIWEFIVNQLSYAMTIFCYLHEMIYFVGTNFHDLASSTPDCLLRYIYMENTGPRQEIIGTIRLLWITVCLQYI